MPTGYTADVVDGKITEFSEFALLCARAFGATITMRDEPLNAPIPDEFPPSDYNAKRLAEARANLSKLTAMTPDEACVSAEADYQEKLQRHVEYERRETEQETRLEAMEAKVRAWTPPTAEHFEMKNFMLEQLRISKRGEYRSPEPQRLSGEDWIAKEIEKAQRDIEYHLTENEKEIERSRQRSEWVKSLRASLAA